MPAGSGSEQDKVCNACLWNQQQSQGSPAGSSCLRACRQLCQRPAAQSLLCYASFHVKKARHIRDNFYVDMVGRSLNKSLTGGMQVSICRWRDSFRLSCAALCKPLLLKWCLQVTHRELQAHCEVEGRGGRDADVKQPPACRQGHLYNVLAYCITGFLTAARY